MTLKKRSPLPPHTKYLDYKNITLLRQFTTYFWKIKPRYYSGAMLQQQKMIAQAIKRARFMALVPFVRG